MKKFYVGVKAILKTEQGYVLLRHAKGHYDMPGGRIDDNEDFEATLRRELAEELPGITDVAVGELVGAYRIPQDIEADTSLVLLYFIVSATLPEQIALSEEHPSYQFITSVEDIPDSLNPEVNKVKF